MIVFIYLKKIKLIVGMNYEGIIQWFQWKELSKLVMHSSFS